MSELISRQGVSGQEERTHQGETVRAEEGCCIPIFSECGPETCGMPFGSDPTVEQRGQLPAARPKVVKLTQAGAQRLFNGEDDEIYSREDLIEAQPDSSLKVTGSCSGTVWLVQKDEIAAVVDT